MASETLCPITLLPPSQHTHTHTHTRPASVRDNPGCRGSNSSQTGKVHRTLEPEGRMEGIKCTDALCWVSLNIIWSNSPTFEVRKLRSDTQALTDSRSCSVLCSPHQTLCLFDLTVSPLLNIPGELLRRKPLNKGCVKALGGVAPAPLHPHPFACYAPPTPRLC